MTNEAAPRAPRAAGGHPRPGAAGNSLLMLVFLALLRDPRAEGATRIPPPALGRLLGLDQAPEGKTIRRKLEKRL